MIKHNVKNITFGVFEHMKVNRDNNGFDFELIDGGTHTVSFDEMSSVFAVLTCVDFGVLLNLINEREDTEETMHDMFNETFDKSVAVNFYEYGNVCQRYGSLRERVFYERNYLKERYGWETWVSACRVYESLSGTPREWIS